MLLASLRQLVESIRPSMPLLYVKREGRWRVELSAPQELGLNKGTEGDSSQFFVGILEYVFLLFLTSCVFRRFE